MTMKTWLSLFQLLLMIKGLLSTFVAKNNLGNTLRYKTNKMAMRKCRKTYVASEAPINNALYLSLK